MKESKHITENFKDTFWCHVALLLWAILGEERDEKETEVYYNHNEKPCHFCAKMFSKELESCPHCKKQQRVTDL